MGGDVTQTPVRATKMSTKMSGMMGADVVQSFALCLSVHGQ